MKKVLFVATVTRHINAFHIPYLKWFKEQGYEVHVASNGNEGIEYCDKHFNLPFARFPLKVDNIKTYKELKKIVNDNNYEIIHCHTPVGGVLTRLAARKKRKKFKTKVIYTAHGFHFYKGAPLINWIIFYPIEKWLARYTDCLITINMEDYELAKKKLKKLKRIEYLPGVGIDEKKFKSNILKPKEKKELKSSLGLKEEDFILIYPAELSDRKNQKMLIEAINLIPPKIKGKIKIILPGKDSKNGEYQKLAQMLGVEKNFLFLGFRTDIAQLMQISDLAVSTSKQEGLPVNLIEAMCMGLPIIATDCRGNRDLIKDTIKINDTNELANRIKQFALRREKKVYTYDINQYLIENIIQKIEKIYGGYKSENM